MSQNTLDMQIGQAWQSHRTGDNQNSLAQFESIINQSPGNIDAHYGLGLVRRAIGQHELAVQAFRKALELVSAIERDESNLEERDRYLILTRMINQRLAETQAAI